MRYNPEVLDDHEWSGKYPSGANRSEKINIYSAGLVLQDARSFDELLHRSERGRWTESGLNYMRKQLSRRVDQLETILERDFDDQIEDYIENVFNHATAVLNQDDPWLQPVVSGTCDWEKIKRSPYEVASDLDYKTNREVDIVSIHRHPKRRQLRVRTDGDSFHKGTIQLNDLPPVKLVERGRRGILFLGNY